MPLDFTKPVVTDNYATGILPPLVDSQKALAQWLDPTAAGTLTGTPIGAMRRVDGTSAVERWNGSAWVAAPINGINLASGNVGVGVTTPLQKFQVKTATDRNAGVQSASIISGGIALKAFDDAGTTQVGLEFGGASYVWEIGGTQRLGLTTTGLTCTVPYAGPLGSAALPSYTFAGDTNTGWWSPAADRQAWSTAGSERMSLDATSLLLGTTTSVAARMGVTAAAASGASSVAAVFGQGASGVAATETRVHIAAGEGVARGIYLSGLNIGGANNAHALVFGVSAASTAPAERMRLTSAGLGVFGQAGVTSPDYPLTVAGDSNGFGISIRGRASDDVGRLAFFDAAGTGNRNYISGGSTEFQHVAYSALVFYVNSGASVAEAARYNASGQYLFGGTGVIARTANWYSGSTRHLLHIENSGTAGTDSQTGVEFYNYNGSAVAAAGGLSALYANQGTDPNCIYLTNARNASLFLLTNNSKRVEVTGAGLLNLINGAGALRLNGHISRFESSEINSPSTTFTTVSATHGGSRVPDSYTAVLRCKTAELGYAVGDEIDLKSDIDGSSVQGINFYANTTDVGFGYTRTSSNPPAIRSKTTGVVTTVTAANWKVVFRASWQ